MHALFVTYMLACVGAFFLCWLGLMGCILVVIVEAIRSAGTIGPRFALLFFAQSRGGQLPERSQRAMELARRFKRWGFRVWLAAFVGGVLGCLVAVIAEGSQHHAPPPPPNHALQRTEAGGGPSPSP